MASQVGESQERESKHIKLFKNGDAFFRGKRVVVNTRRDKDLDIFCQGVSDVMGLRQGAVQRLHTPNTGTRITDIKQLEHGGNYVAVPNTAFKRLNYVEGPTQPAASTPKEIRPVQHSKQFRAKSSQYRKIPIKGTNFRVYQNGTEKSTIINLKPVTARGSDNWIHILDIISENLGIACNALYTAQGEPIKDVTTLRERGNNQIYVAVNKTDEFRHIQYGPQASRNTSRKEKKPLPPIAKGKGSSNESSAEGTRDEPFHAGCIPRPKTVMKFNKNGRPIITPPERKQQAAKRPAGRKQKEQKKKEEEEDVFHAKPVKHTPNGSRKQKPKDYDKDEENGVFRAKDENTETKDAEEIQDSDETQTAYTIDQVEAEEVQEDLAEPETSPTPPQKKKKLFDLFGLFLVILLMDH